jgi:hypothetical protein
MTSAGVATASEEEEDLHKSTSGDQYHDKKQSIGNRRCRVKPHLVDGEARLGVASVLAQRDDS